jgi:ferredoxin
MHLRHSDADHGPHDVHVKFIIEDPEALTGDAKRTDAECMAAQGEHLLEVAVEEGINIEHSCGGVCACSTCHVYVTRGKELLTEAEEDEEDILDKAFDVRATSRLGCQATIEKDGEIECEITRESLDAFYNEHPQEKDPRRSH